MNWERPVSKLLWGLGVVAPACNPSHMGGADWDSKQKHEK
jgi:hypothetical protein